MLVFGRELNLPYDIRFTGNHDTELQGGLDDFIIRLKERLDHAHTVTLEYQIQAAAVNKAAYDKKRKDVSFHKGQQVLVKNHPKSQADRGRIAKFEPKYNGPFIVNKTVGSHSVILADPNSGKLVGKYHIRDLRNYYPSVAEEVDTSVSEPNSAVSSDRKLRDRTKISAPSRYQT